MPCGRPGGRPKTQRREKAPRTVGLKATLQVLNQGGGRGLPGRTAQGNGRFRKGGPPGGLQDVGVTPGEAGHSLGWRPEGPWASPLGHRGAAPVLRATL